MEKSTCFSLWILCATIVLQRKEDKEGKDRESVSYTHLDVYKRQSMTVLLQNDTDLRVVFGDDYKLMKAGTGGAGVEELPPIAETGHNDIAYMPTRGEPVTLTVN